MIFREEDNWLEIVVVERVSPHLPGSGDTNFALVVQVEGFAGSGSAWVDGDRLNAFVEALRRLEADRRGEAEIESISPDNFRLRIWVTDSAGHMALEGRLSDCGQSLNFGFAFCPSRLPALLTDFTAIAVGQN